MEQKPTVKHMTGDGHTTQESEALRLFDNGAEANAVNELSSQFLEPVPSTWWIRVLGMIFIGLGIVTLLVGIIVFLGGLSSLQQTSSINVLGQLSNTTNALGVLLGGVFMLYSLPMLAIGVILLLLADIRTEMAQSRKILAATLKTQLAIYEKS